MKARNRRKPKKRELHFLNKDGMVACNPRDCEAAHRAEVGGNRIRESAKGNLQKVFGCYQKDRALKKFCKFPKVTSCGEHGPLRPRILTS